MIASSRCYKAHGKAHRNYYSPSSSLRILDAHEIAPCFDLQPRCATIGAKTWLARVVV